MRGNEQHRRAAKAVLADGRYVDIERRTGRNEKLSSIMAMLLGILITLEIMVAGVMVFKIDIRTADVIGMFFAFAVVYFGVVAVLTDK